MKTQSSPSGSQQPRLSEASGFIPHRLGDAIDDDTRAQLTAFHWEHLLRDLATLAQPASESETAA